MRRHLAKAFVFGAMCAGGHAHGQALNAIFEENFNGVTLGPSVNERRGALSFPMTTGLTPGAARHVVPSAYSHTGPAGWTVDNTFDNFGNTDLNNDLGTPVYDLTTPPGDPPVLLFKTGITGLVVGNVGVPNVGSSTAGPDEWEGWSFANKDFWTRAAGDQDRSQFALASGTVAVVDPDEYDDGGDGGLTSGLAGGYYNSGLTTAAIPVTGLSTVSLAFDSSWRSDEVYDDTHSGLGFVSNNQTAVFWATFDDGAGNTTLTDVAIWDSDNGHVSEGPTDPVPARPASSTFKANALNERVTLPNVSVPTGATSVKFTFGYINAANDWWWAIDNLAASDGSNPAFWTENFESVPLGPSTNEFEANDPTFTQVTAANNDPATTPFPVAFTHTPPTGWTIDNSGIKPETRGDNNRGVYEWEGWTFAERDFWAGAQGSNAQGFLKGDGPFAIADSDEFDDFGRNPDNVTPNPNYTRPMNTVLATPSIDVAGATPDSLYLKFDSAWLPEGAQKAVITADFGLGETEVLRWESETASAFYHGDALNETVLVDLNNPAGASSLVVRFKYLDGSNNWFWAFDNLAVGTLVPEPGTTSLVAAAIAGLGLRRRRSR